MKLQRCWSLTRYPVRGTWYRAVQARWASTPLAHAHTATQPGRFNSGSAERPGVEAIYLTDDPRVALIEVREVIGSGLPGQPSTPNPNPRAWTVYPVSVELLSVADLTRDEQLQLVDTSVQELTGDWLGYYHRPQHRDAPPPYFTHVPTQQLAVALYQTGQFEGLVSYSAVDPRHRNLIVFPALFQSSSTLSCTDGTGVTHHLPPAPVKRRKR